MFTRKMVELNVDIMELLYVQGVFLTGTPLKSSKYKKSQPRLG